MARRGSIKCPKCDRTFKLALHLGRHMAATHKAKSVRERAARKSSVKPSRGAAVPLTYALALRAWRDELTAQQAQLAAQVAALNELLAASGDAAPRPHPRAGVRSSTGRGKARDGSLKSYIHRALRATGRPMRVAQIADAVRKAAFPTKNKTLAKTIGKALTEMPGVKKVARGTFRAV